MRSPCPNKELCGSCGWSHIPYERQLEQKLGDINGSLRLKGLDVACREVEPSPVTAHYRNRMDFAIDFGRRVGLRQKGKWWRVIDGHACFLADERIEELFGIVRSWVKECGLSGFDRNAFTGLLRHAVIRATLAGGTLINLVTSDPAAGEGEAALLDALAELERRARPTTLTWTVSHGVADVSWGDELHVFSGPGAIEEIVAGMRYRISPQAFFQTNSHAAPLLLDAVASLAGELRGLRVLDLYCGTGFFSVFLARQGPAILGLEADEQAVADARLNAAQNRVEVEFRAAKIEEQDPGLLDAEVVLLDPPRSGLHDQALAALLAARPPVLVYVSCNPKSFARELTYLRRYYAVEELRAIDMFPHTPHVELVSRLVRR